MQWQAYTFLGIASLGTMLGIATSFKTNVKLGWVSIGLGLGIFREC